MSGIIKPYSDLEKSLLIELIKKYNIVENKQTDSSMLKKKKMGWKLITTEYNSQPEVLTKRSDVQLKKLWMNLKQKKRKENTALKHSQLKTGGGPPDDIVCDPALKSVEIAAPNFDVTLENVFDSDHTFLMQFEEIKKYTSQEIGKEIEKESGKENETHEIVREDEAQETDAVQVQTQKTPKTTKRIESENYLKRKRTDLSIQYLKEEHEARMEIMKLEKEKVELEIYILKKNNNML